MRNSVPSLGLVVGLLVGAPACFEDVGDGPNDGAATESEGDGDGDPSGDGDGDGDPSGDGDGDGDPSGDGDGDPSGDGDGDGDGDPSGDGDGDPDPVCGDGVVNGDEVCDDGMNLGAAAGDCSPDCSTVVVEKIIRLSVGAAFGDFAPNQNPVAVADGFCPPSYKAMFVDGTNRVATLQPYLGNGQVDWVLHPWTAYVNAAAEPLWTTTEIDLIGVDQNHEWVGLQNPIAPAGFIWTGMRVDYTASPATCSSWSSQGGGLQGIGAMANASQTGPSVIGSVADNGGLCGFERSFYCVEQ